MALCAGPGPTRAQYGSTAEVVPPIAAGAEGDPTAAATVIRRQDAPGALPTVAELLREVAGARARALGSIGAFAGVSIRGADLSHTTVLLGDVPLSAEGVAFDLSSVPLSALSAVEVYRGGAPVALGATGLGGVVRLVPRQEEGRGAELRAAVGSFGRVEVDAASRAGGPDGGVVTSAGLRRERGDYPYVDDGGTRLTPGDDVERRRRNGEVDQAYALARGRATVGGGEVSALALAVGRAGGLTGSPVEEPVHTRRRQTRALAGASYRHRRARSRVGVAAAADLERQRFDDPFGEIAFTPRATDDRTASAWSRADVGLEVAPALTLTAVGTHRLTVVRPRDDLADAQVPASRRHRVALAAEARAHGRAFGRRAELRASARLDVARSALREIRDERIGQAVDGTHVVPGARLAAVIEAAPGLALSASLAREARLPTVTELFGDRGFLLGDARLRPEAGLTGEIGAVARGRAGPVDGAAELRAYAQRVDDLVRYVRTAQFQLTPENVGRARLLGVEAAVRGRAGRHLALTAALTALSTHDEAEDRELPLRPRLEAYARPELRLGPFGPVDAVAVFADVTHVGASFTDRRNQVVLGARTVLGAGASFEALAGRIAVIASAQDLLDARPRDLVGFPLPGRRFGVAVRVRTGDP